MTSPPLIAALLLRAALSGPYARYVIADLDQEYRARLMEGLEARRWYWWQVLRSVWELSRRDLEMADWEAALLCLAVATAGPVLALDALWSWSLSLVPLKAGLERGLDCTLLMGGTLLLCGGACGALMRLRALVLAIPGAWMFVILGVAASRGVLPAAFSLVLLAAVAFGLMAGATARRLVKT